MKRFFSTLRKITIGSVALLIIFSVGSHIGQTKIINPSQKEAVKPHRETATKEVKAESQKNPLQEKRSESTTATASPVVTLPN
jgi:hypothetical protein